MQPVLAFWIIYVLTRPLGASIGDYLTQPPAQSGLGLGSSLTTLIFVVGIVVTVTYLSLTKADATERRAASTVTADEAAQRGGLRQTIAVVALVLVSAGTGRTVGKSSLAQDTGEPASAAPPEPRPPAAPGRLRCCCSVGAWPQCRGRRTGQSSRST